MFCIPPKTKRVKSHISVNIDFIYSYIFCTKTKKQNQNSWKVQNVPDLWTADVLKSFSLL